MKKFTISLILTVLAIAVLLFTKDMVIKASVEKGVEAMTGLKLSIGSLKVGILKSYIGIKDMKLYNPAGYPDKLMADMPEIYVDYDLGSIMKGNVHLRELRLEMKECVVEKNQEGKLNLDSLKVVQIDNAGKKTSEAGKKQRPPQIQVDKLRLKIGKVLYKDYSAPGPEPNVTEFNVNIDEEYTNIEDAYMLVSLIVVQALRNTTIANFTNLDLRGLERMASVTAQKAQRLMTRTAETTGKVVSAAAETLENVLKNPFGSGEDKR